MKTIKIFDASVSFILILFFTWAAITDFQLMYSEPFISGYLVVGGWQLISMVFHAVRGWNPAGNRTRNIYFLITVILLITMPVGSIWILILISPFMALFYTGYCIYEISCIKTRPIELLK